MENILALEAGIIKEDFHTHIRHLISSTRLQIQIQPLHLLFGEMVSKFLDRTKEIEQLLNDLPRLAKENPSVTLECILMIHPAVKADNLNDPDVVHSQDLVYRLLKQRTSSIVGCEGTSLSRVSIRSFLKESVERQAILLGQHGNVHSMKKSLKKVIHIHGYLRFLQEHLSAHLVGIEDPSTLNLHFMIDRICPTDEIAMSNLHPLANLNKLLIRLRTYISVALLYKAIEANQEKKHGVLVVGAGHWKEFVSLHEELGIGIKFLETARPEFLDQFPRCRVKI